MYPNLPLRSYPPLNLPLTPPPQGPEIEIDLDALLGGVMGEEKKDNKDEETVDQMEDPDIHGLNKLGG